MNGVVATTQRLSLRRMTYGDRANLLQIFSDPVAMQYYPSTMNEEETMRWIRRTLANYDTYGVGFWVVEDKATGRFLGQCGIIPQDLDGTRHMEIAYLFVRREWGHGYATEAASACKQYGFDTMGYAKLISLIDVRNAPSMRVAERIGMRVEKIIIKWAKEVRVYAISAG
ncbi:GNAT family N-acetyltransferase [Sulfobacillus harzensis]|uniref:GNAT family N-acetyltransferase n=1 Tax=Sulfobacillus harzensis TaxID=2729629 RepID=A0A7Y0L6T0_9FIRM|nr:GNAT family N-acetyltransferase [Sulfobacillus harzensis]NMP22974.1 GNAT family N-acetyltransferase [Sulfobacillus harzensis]